MFWVSVPTFNSPRKNFKSSLATTSPPTRGNSNNHANKIAAMPQAIFVAMLDSGLLALGICAPTTAELASELCVNVETEVAMRGIVIKFACHYMKNDDSIESTVE